MLKELVRGRPSGEERRREEQPAAQADEPQAAAEFTGVSYIKTLIT